MATDGMIHVGAGLYCSLSHYQRQGSAKTGAEFLHDIGPPRALLPALFFVPQVPDGHGHRPLVLAVFDDYLADGNFIGVARSEMERTRVAVPLWVSHREILARVGLLGMAWRNPKVLEPSLVFQ